MNERQRDLFLWVWSRRRTPGQAAIGLRGAIIGALGGVLFTLMLIGDIGADRGSYTGISALLPLLQRGGMLLLLSVGAFGAIGFFGANRVFARRKRNTKPSSQTGAPRAGSKARHAAGRPRPCDRRRDRGRRDRRLYRFRLDHAGLATKVGRKQLTPPAARADQNRLISGDFHVAARNHVRRSGRPHSPARRLRFRAGSRASPRRRSIIHAGRLLADASTGRVLTEQSILVGADGNIIAIEPGYVTQDGATIIDQRNRFVLPGPDRQPRPPDQRTRPEPTDRRSARSPPSDAALRGAENARITLMAGFTTVADLGANNDSIFALRRAIAERRIPGPRIIASGSAVTPDGGHGDANGFAPDVSERHAQSFGLLRR